ncbi:MAG: HPr family phosphocarrier protein [Bacteroidales bacterium]|nr:HPr family phosphocarrier protein [Bacteroidales bacterium]MBQ9888942.1 HPr family phosphocarrier protein [Bacteroidales bacterium]
MTTESITIEAPNGLHARPVTELVRLVKSFAGTKVTLATAAREVRADSMLSILSLGLKKGTEVKVSADGPQEEEAVKAIVESIRSVTE